MKRLALVLASVAVAVAISAHAAHAATMRVAVLDFTNGSTSKEYDALGKGLQSMVTTDLSAVPSLQLVERSRLQEVQAELKLQQSSAIDPKTASKLGKLAGATHLLTGSFTVVGDKMRLDARLFSVLDGAVLLAAKDEGEKDAFFELEKSLVKKLVETVGIKLAPKERAAVQKMHTTDFDAFSKFSSGIALFDEKKYSDAIAALKDASAKDKDFKLATLTLGEYERLISEMRTEATSLEKTQKEMDRLAKLLESEKEAKAEQDSVQKLYAISKNKDPARRRERLAAMFILAMEHNDNLNKLAKLQDFFAMQRTGDALSAAYFADASPRFAEDPMPLVVISGYSHRLPAIATFDKDWNYLVEEFGRESGKVATRKLVQNLNTNWLQLLEFGDRLHLDRKQAVALKATLIAQGKKLQPDPAFWLTETRHLAAEHRRVLELEKSSTILAGLAAGMKDPSTLRELADELEVNKQITALLASHKRPVDKYFREYILLKYPHLYPHQWEYLRNEWDGNTGDGLSPKALYLLSELRVLPDYRGQTGRVRSLFGYVLLGDTTVWAVHSNLRRGSESSGTGVEDGAETLNLVTGARSDFKRTDELRYYGDGKKPVEPMIIADGLSKKDVALRFTVSFTPAADWWPRNVYHRDRKSIADANLESGKPEVGFLYGVRGIDAHRQPLHGYAVLIGDKGARHVEIAENPAASYKPAVEPYTYTDKGNESGSAPGATIKVTAKVAGDTVKVTVDGKSYSFKAPAERTGFYGVFLRGKGYASIHHLVVE